MPKRLFVILPAQCKVHLSAYACGLVTARHECFDRIRFAHQVFSQHPMAIARYLHIIFNADANIPPTLGQAAAARWYVYTWFYRHRHAGF
jgi:hypothetical protein